MAVRSTTMRHPALFRTEARGGNDQGPARGRAPKEVGTLDFDPFVDAQDWEIASFDIAVNDAGPGKASATVKFANLDSKSTVVLDLVKIKGAWKISNITWTPHDKPNTLRGLFAL